MERVICSEDTAVLKLKRVYDPAAASDGTRILVERLWPRGISKASLLVDAWPREVGPTTELRKWFGHDSARWRAFRRRYFLELDARPDAWRNIMAAARRGPVTLLYSSRDQEHNNAVALKDYIEAKLLGRSPDE